MHRRTLISNLVAASFAATGLALVAHVGPTVAAKYSQEQVSALFKQADANKDGVLNKEEVDKLDPALDVGFDKADADKDGKLTSKEFANLVNT